MSTEVLINKRYVLNKRIGKGSYGVVHLGYDKIDKKYVAIKLEHQQGKKRLEYEYKIYQCMDPSKISIPKIYWYGKEDEYNILVMEQLGNSLDQLFKSCDCKFGIKTTIMIAIQLIDLIQSVHFCRHIHRDIKPENFLFGVNEKRNYLHVIDFGLSKRFKNDDRIHCKMGTGKKLVGTARYASINSHLGNELSRRDDLESIGYMLIYFLKGTLPWMYLPGNTREERYKIIQQKKESTSLDSLCKNLPAEFLQYMKIVRSLSYKEKPKYFVLRELFTGLAQRMNIKLDYKYDWY